MARLFRGIVPAVVTPFREDERIDFDAWQRILDALIASHVDGVSVGGGQGEFFSLSIEERTVALRFCAQWIAGRITVYGNVGCVNTRDTVKLAQTAESLGVNCLVVVTPFYLKPSGGELVEHFVEICRSVSIPVLANNNPERTGVDLTPELVSRIAEQCENFAGLKDSSGRLERISTYRSAGKGRKLAVFTGCDELVFPALEKNASGAISASANIAPRLFVDLFAAFEQGQFKRAAQLQALASELAATLALHTFPGVLKEAMQMSGRPAGPCRKPVGFMPADVRRKVGAVLEKLAESGYIARTARIAGA